MTLAPLKVYFLIGASGAGKTTLLNKLKPLLESKYVILHFDSIGVPSFEQMKVEHGSLEGWQKAKTHEWLEKIDQMFLVDKDVIFDAQIRPSFIQEACEHYKIDYEILLIHCDDQERERRLIKRVNKDLVSKEMRNWSCYLKNECTKLNCYILNTASLSIDQALHKLVGYFIGQINKR